MSTSIPGATGDPLPAPALTEGTWRSLRAGHRLIYIGRDQVLDWVPSTGGYRIWKVDRSAAGGADPLPGPVVCEGQWATIKSGHEIVYLGGDRLLSWRPEERRYRVWLIDRAATGNADPLPGVPQTNGLWSTIGSGHRLVSLDGDRVLDWELSTNRFRVFRHDPAAMGAADPLPGPPLAEITWGALLNGHQLIALGPDRVLDWAPATGRYQVLRHDRGSTGNPFPGDPDVTGRWETVRDGHELVYLDGDRVLGWEPATGHFRVWRYDRNVSTLLRTTVRFHIKMLTEPFPGRLDEMVSNAKKVYASYGIDLVEASREVLQAGDGTPLAQYQGLNVGDCDRAKGWTSHQAELYERRGNAGPGDIVVFFVRNLVWSGVGCATHPPDRPSAAIAARHADEWTLAHEIGHVLGLSHVKVSDRNRLMNDENMGRLTNPPPDLVAEEIQKIIASPFSKE